MNIDNLNIGIEDSVDKEVYLELFNSLQHLENVDFHNIPSAGPQFGIQLTMPTAIAIMFGSAFINALGEKAGQDFYPHMEEGLTNVYAKYFGKDPQIKTVTIVGANSKNKAPKTRYSLTLSLYVMTKENQRIKFLYVTDWTKDEFDLATRKYTEEITQIMKSDTGKVKALMNNKNKNATPFLVAWDESTDKFIHVDPYNLSDSNLVK